MAGILPKFTAKNVLQAKSNNTRMGISTIEKGRGTA
jgi:hypothetical protein